MPVINDSHAFEDKAVSSNDFIKKLTSKLKFLKSDNCYVQCLDSNDQTKFAM